MASPNGTHLLYGCGSNGTLFSAGSGTSLPRKLGEVSSGGGREMTEYMAGERTERGKRQRHVLKMADTGEESSWGKGFQEMVS